MFGESREETKERRRNKRENKSKEKRAKSLQDLLNINEIDDNYILTTKYRYYIRLLPKNLNILTHIDKLDIIENLKNVMNSIGIRKFEFLIVDKTERLEDNKNFLNKLIKNNDDPLFKELLEDELDVFNIMTSNNNSSREFFVIVENDKENDENLRFLHQALNQKDFETEFCTKNDLKNMLQVYLERNFSNKIVDDFNILKIN